MLRREFAGRANASADPVDRGGFELAEQAVAPCFEFARREQRDRLCQQHGGQVTARVLGVVGIGAARGEVALVVDERAIDRNRRGRVGLAVAAGQFLRGVLRLEERQDLAAVALVEVVGFGKGFRPVFAVAVARLEHPRSVGLVAAVMQLHAARDRWAVVRLAPNGELQAGGAGFELGVANLASHDAAACVPENVSMVRMEAYGRLYIHAQINATGQGFSRNAYRSAEMYIEG